MLTWILRISEDLVSWMLRIGRQSEASLRILSQASSWRQRPRRFQQNRDRNLRKHHLMRKREPKQKIRNRKRQKKQKIRNGKVTQINKWNCSKNTAKTMAVWLFSNSKPSSVLLCLYSPQQPDENWQQNWLSVEMCRWKDPRKDPNMHIVWWRETPLQPYKCKECL